MKVPDNKYLASDWRSLELHRIVARRLLADPSVLDHALANIARWRKTTGVSLDEWESIIAKGPRPVLRVLLGKTQEAARLRSSTPFTGIISPEERAAVFARFSGK